MKLRWVVPLLFVAGYLGTFTRFESAALEYAVLTGVSIVACCFLLSQLNRPLQATLPFWVILALFLLAYYVKFYWITSFPEMELLTQFFFANQSYYLSSTVALLSAFATTTFAFGSFCLVAGMLLGMARRRPMAAAGPRPMPGPSSAACDYRFVSAVALGTALVLTPLTTFIMQVYGIGVMGVEGVSLPFHLAGLVYYTRGVLCPAMLVLLIWSSQQAGLPKRATLGVVLVVMLGLSDMVLRSSRGGLVAALLLLGFLLLVSQRRVQRRAVALFAGGALLASLLFPIVSEYRSLRIGNAAGDILSLFLDAQRSVTGGGLVAIWGALALGISSVLMRVTGIDMLALYHGLAVQPLGDAAWAVLASPRGIPGYVTVDVMGYSADAIQASAPSLVGWFYLIGGNPLSVLGMAAVTSAAAIAWGLLRRLRLRSLPVAQVLFLSLLLSTAMDGTIDSMLNWTLLAWPASIAVCELLCRVSTAADVRRSRSP